MDPVEKLSITIASAGTVGLTLILILDNTWVKVVLTILH